MYYNKLGLVTLGIFCLSSHVGSESRIPNDEFD